MSEPFTSDVRKIVDDHLALPTKLPIVFLMILTSFPAGLMPFIAFGAHSEMQHAQQITTRWRNENQIESARKTALHAAWVSVAAILAHLSIVGLAIGRWDHTLLGLRGWVFMVLAWGVFSLGVTSGIWVLSIAPH